MESNEVVNTKINPILIVVGIILIVASAIIGWYVGGNKDNRPLENEKEETKVEEKVENDSIYEVELSDQKFENNKDISLKDIESIKGFVSVTDAFTNDELRNVFLISNEYLINDFKLIYVLSSLIGGDGGVYYFSTEFLNSEVKQVFNSGIDSFDYMSGNYWLSAVGISYVCSEKICSVYLGAGGGTGSPYYSTEIVSTKKDGENTIYTLKEYYDDFHTGYYVSDGGELLCKHGTCPENIIEAYGDKLNTYEMTFDKDNRYISSKKIS